MAGARITGFGGRVLWAGLRGLSSAASARPLPRLRDGPGRLLSAQTWGRGGWGADRQVPPRSPGVRLGGGLSRPLLQARQLSGGGGGKEARLEGRCSCGKCGFVGVGPSVINFYSHSSAPRAVSGEPFLAAAAFRGDQVLWTGGEALVTTPPPGSLNPHFRCGGCGDYLGVDAQRLLGVVALNLVACDQVDDSYRPNCHTFYTDRVADVDDGLPKWSTVPEGDIEDTPTGMATAAKKPPVLGGAIFGQWSPETGRYHKDVGIISPFKSAEANRYHFTESDPAYGHRMQVSQEKMEERVARKYIQQRPGAFVAPASRDRDVVVVGGGHNGLTAAAYLAGAGLDVLVLERRPVLGGAAVTEEIVPGFKFSRASYLAGLMRPQVIQELQLEDHGFEYLPREVSSFTPTLVDGPHRGMHLMMGADADLTHRSISQWSARDADVLADYDYFLDRVRDVIQPVLDHPPTSLGGGGPRDVLAALRGAASIAAAGWKNRDSLVPMYELVTGPASHLLDRWFDGEVLKTTLATDAVIGAMVSPRQAGSAYVLLHHVMGEAAGRKGVWAYMRGGMGTISSSIAAAAEERGAEIVTDAAVRRILVAGDGPGSSQAVGVEMVDGTEIRARAVVSGASPYHTFMELLPGYPCSQGDLPGGPVPQAFAHHLRFQDQSCGAFKINLAVSELPNFLCRPSDPSGAPGPQHLGTVHLEEHMDDLENAYREAAMGVPATKPVVEMTIPSAVDGTLAPPGKHVVQLFVQFAPYDVNPKVGHWADPSFKDAFVRRVLAIVDQHCPNFSESILGMDALSPLDLERVFGLHKGNIFHGAMSLHQLAHARPMAGFSGHRSPVVGLYMGSAGSHPGGGVMGAPGRNCAGVVLRDLKG